jgi:hypothetical protein
VKRLYGHHYQVNDHLIREKCRSEAYLSSNGIQFKSKSFSLRHFGLLMLRMLASTKWIANWSLVLLIVGLAVVLTQLYSSDIGKPDGCLGKHFVLYQI